MNLQPDNAVECRSRPENTCFIINYLLGRSAPSFCTQLCNFREDRILRHSQNFPQCCHTGPAERLDGWPIVAAYLVGDTFEWRFSNFVQWCVLRGAVRVIPKAYGVLTSVSGWLPRWIIGKRLNLQRARLILPRKTSAITRVFIGQTVQNVVSSVINNSAAWLDGAFVKKGARRI